MIIIRKAGFLIDISRDHDFPILDVHKAALEKALTFTETQHLRGRERYDSVTGDKQNIRFIPTALYRYDAQQRFVCLKGYLPMILEFFRAAGEQVALIDKDPPRARPDCYSEDWQRIFSGDMEPPRDWQRECLYQLAIHDGGIVDVATGSGKSYMQKYICALFPKARIGIVVTGLSVLNMTRDRLQEVFPSIGIVGDGKKRYGPRINVYSSRSLSHARYDDDIVVVDEPHELTSDAAIADLTKFERARMYGTTATVATRGDGRHAVMPGLYGPVIYARPYEEAVTAGDVVPIHVEWHPVRMDDPCENLQDTAKKRYGIWRNTIRNVILANAVQKYHDDGAQVLVLVETIEHLLHLRRLLPEFHVAYAGKSLAEEQNRCNFVEAGLWAPDELPLSAEHLDVLRIAFAKGHVRGVIATGVWNRAVDFPQLDVVGIAHGNGSKTAATQGPGRASRKFEGKSYGIVVDLADHFNKGFYHNFTVRRAEYAKNGWSQSRSDGR